MNRKAIEGDRISRLFQMNQKAFAQRVRQHVSPTIRPALQSSPFMQIVLPPELEALVQRQITSGKYQTQTSDRYNSTVDRVDGCQAADIVVGAIG